MSILQTPWQRRVASGRMSAPEKLDDNPKVALFLQGGGALGAYQAGVYSALAKAGIHADWASGISIGAFNAAIIAGNPPQKRAEKLKGFWERISTTYPDPSLSGLLGVPGFFRAAGTGYPDSIFDISPMRRTLKEFVDFDYLNDRSPTRLSVAAADEKDHHDITYFDSRKGADSVPHIISNDPYRLSQRTQHSRIGPEHIMASGALKPAFPVVEIDGKCYVDAGLTPGANSPARWAHDTGQLTPDMFVVCADLWKAPSGEQTAILNYHAREQKKDRQFSCPDLNISPSEVSGLICLVLKRQEELHRHDKDYDFSAKAIHANWEAGFTDMMEALDKYLDTKALKDIICRNSGDGRSHLSQAMREPEALASPRRI